MVTETEVIDTNKELKKNSSKNYETFYNEQPMTSPKRYEIIRFFQKKNEKKTLDGLKDEITSTEISIGIGKLKINHSGS